MPIPADEFSRLRSAGLAALPATRLAKRPALPSWKEYTRAFPHTTPIPDFADAICVVCGEVSGNLEIIDFDQAGSAFPDWIEAIPPDLAARLIIQRTQSGGKHAVYRCQDKVSGNLKLASRVVDGRPQTLIETRGEGGLFLCAPTPGYQIEQGEHLTRVPTLTAGERDTLLSAAWRLDEARPPVDQPGTISPPVDQPRAPASADNSRPGDDFNARGNPLDSLLRAGWTIDHSDATNLYLRRPGKTAGQSATLRHDDRTLFVFSSNAPPFEPSKAYSPFATYAAIEHAGDFEEASRALRLAGYGGEAVEATGVDLSAFLTPVIAVPNELDLADRCEPGPADPGPFPDHLLYPPGLISRVIEHNLATCFKPQPVLALAAAISLTATLTGRRIRDEWNTRTNLYILGVCESGGGKEHARQINKEILHLATNSTLLAPESFASAAGIVSCLEVKSCCLAQVDEIGRFLKTTGDSANPWLYATITVLMKLFSSAGSTYLGDAYSDAKRNKTVNQPHLVLYGTTVPQSLYEGLTAESVSDGFLSRCLIFEGSLDVDDVEQPHRAIPQDIITAAEAWFKRSPGGNLGSENPAPTVIETTEEAKEAMRDLSRQANDARRALPPDEPTAALWTRVVEKARKLALIYAASRSTEAPLIDLQAAQWASELSLWLTRRLVLLASERISRSRYEADQKKIWKIIQSAGPAGLPMSKLANRCRWLRAKERAELLADMITLGHVREVKEETGGRMTTKLVAVRAG